MSGPFGATPWMYDHTDFYPLDINQSLKFNDDESQYLSWTPTTAGNRKTWTWSGWVKRGNIGTTQDIFIAGSNVTGQLSTQVTITSGSILQIYSTISGSAAAILLQTTQVFRDVSAWYHIVLQVNTTDGTASNRVKLYVNGEQVTSFSTATYPSQNYDTAINNSVIHTLGRFSVVATNYFDGYLSEVYFIDGQALAPTNFGEFKEGIWIPKVYNGTYGSNGFHLEFNSNTNDTSGNGNNWTANNISAHDYVPDSPTNNFGVMSSIDKGDGTATYSEGNLKVSVGDNEEAFGSFGMSSGKWYWEIRYVSSAAGNNKIGLGIADTATPNNNEVTNNGHQGTTYAPNDILAVAVDVDNKLFSFYKNGTIIETNTDWSAKGWTSIKPIVTSSNSAGEEVCIFNFGQDSTFAGATTAGGNTDGNGIGDFKYAPPANYLALCTANLPTPTIVDGSEHFSTVLYTGTGAPQSITGANLAPDLLWIKRRNAVNSHILYDSVRGDWELSSNSTGTEISSAGRIGSLDADGFTFENTSAGTLNASGGTYASWLWKAGGAAVSNTAGTITSQVSANVDAGFSIATWTHGSGSQSIGHGLGTTPSMIILKGRSYASSWWVWHQSLSNPAQSFLNLNTTSAVGANVSAWDNQAPTSSVFYQKEYILSAGDTGVAYCFADVEGFSKAGSYVGNGSADGPYIYLGFRASWIMIKNTLGVNSWCIYDVERDTYNVSDALLQAQDAAAEATYGGLDFTSNGFKIRSSVGALNGSGNTLIYLAFSENPFKYSNAR